MCYVSMHLQKILKHTIACKSNVYLINLQLYQKYQTVEYDFLIIMNVKFHMIFFSPQCFFMVI